MEFVVVALAVTDAVEAAPPVVLEAEPVAESEAVIKLAPSVVVTLTPHVELVCEWCLCLLEVELELAPPAKSSPPIVSVEFALAADVADAPEDEVIEAIPVVDINVAVAVVSSEAEVVAAEVSE